METSKSSLDDQSICEKVILAPMVRGSELAFRTMIRRYGVTHCFSPMLRAAEVVKAFQIWKERDDNGNYNNDLSTTCRVTHEDGILESFAPVLFSPLALNITPNTTSTMDQEQSRKSSEKAYTFIWTIFQLIPTKDQMATTLI
jgi:hypothetical protein